VLAVATEVFYREEIRLTSRALDGTEVIRLRV